MAQGHAKVTAYTCKRLCCSVEIVQHGNRPTDIILNGVMVTTSALAQKLDVSHQAIRRRLDNGNCLAQPRQPGNRIRRHRLVGMNLSSDTNRWAALFLRLPLVAA